LRVANWKFYLDQRRGNCAAAAPDIIKQSLFVAKWNWIFPQHAFVFAPRRAIRVHELPAARNKSGALSLLSFSKTFILDAFAAPNFPFSECLSFCYLLLNCARKEITNIPCMPPQFIAKDALFAPTKWITVFRLYCCVAEAPAVHCFSHCGVIFC
jgi:hypothetical protein